MSENNVVEVHCKHYVKRKKRFCKMTVKRGFEYCGEHLPSVKADAAIDDSNDSSNAKLIRITCPLDNKHTCFAHKLQKHLKICNAKPNPTISYISKGVNCGLITPNATRSLSSVRVENLKVLIQKIDKIYAEFIEGKILNSIKSHQIVENEISKPEYGDQKKKHLIQASSLLGLLESNELVQNDTCYIEFGAGKGQLSYWIAQTIENLTDASVLLVERASHRHKFDNKLDKSDGKVHRIKADIADLILRKVDALNNVKNVVGITKHLCGDATDLTIRCLSNYESVGGKVSGIIMAFCCHHRCQWSAYIGQQFFEVNKLDANDFDAMCGMVSWAICGSGMSRGTTEDVKQSDRDKELGLTRDEKTEIGRKCKRIIDYGRLTYLEAHGYATSLNMYVEAKISPENVCIVALKR